jgi:hypothetical protein
MTAMGDRWNSPLQMIRDGEDSFEWTHSKIASHLARHWKARPEGYHCESTKIWPF